MRFWPKHTWESLMPLKYVCQMDPEKLSDKTKPSYELEYIDISSVSLEEGVRDRQILTFEEAPSRARRRVASGDTIISTVRTYLKAIAFIESAEENWTASTGFCVLRPSPSIHPKFLYRAIQSKPFIDAVVARSDGVSYPAINPSVLGRIEVPLPSIKVQLAVVEFLDSEISRIDLLVKRLGGYDAARASGAGSLIALVVEKRSALITAAVTGQIDVATWGGRGETDRRLDRIEDEMSEEEARA